MTRLKSTTFLILTEENDRSQTGSSSRAVYNPFLEKSARRRFSRVHATARQTNGFAARTS